MTGKYHILDYENMNNLQATFIHIINYSFAFIYFLYVLYEMYLAVFEINLLKNMR